MALCGK